MINSFLICSRLSLISNNAISRVQVDVLLGILQDRLMYRKYMVLALATLPSFQLLRFGTTGVKNGEIQALIGIF